MKIFIDGRAGTTGLQIEERLRRLPDVTLLDIPKSDRKNPEARMERYREADAVFLCLPDDASREAVRLAGDMSTILLDASTAHRTSPGWAYGFPELSPTHRDNIASSRRIAVPGCHATGFAALVVPLRQRGLLSGDTVLSCHSLTGYSGGGHGMITEYEGENPPGGARPYALTLNHKHLPEMQAVCDLQTAPIFMPILAPVRQGMIVSVPLAMEAARLHEAISEHYKAAAHIHVAPLGGEAALEAGRLSMEARNNTDDMDIFVFGHKTASLLCARFDNLGKGAAGAAVQCLTLATTGND